MRPGPLVVVGDALLDIDLDGTADRVCPDAPVPVVAAVRERCRAGGAGLAATLAAELGRADVTLVTALADDHHGDRLAGLLAGRVRLARLPLRGETVRKTRVRAAGQSLVRVDQGDGRAADEPVGDHVAAAIRAAGAVLVADYGRGVAAHAGIRRLLAELPGGVPVVWDPHPRGAPPLRGARLVTPNRAEARAFAPAPPGVDDPVGQAAADAAALVPHWQVGGVAVTLGAQGALLRTGRGVPFAVPAPGVAGRPDACGAGDCFAAAAALALRDGRTLTEAVTEAVHRASAFVVSGGVHDDAGGPEAGRHAWEVIRRTRELGGTVVATGGCFDLLHAGHISLLRQARALGDCLVVCLNSDSSVRELKGPGRPVVGEQDRARVLAALDCVDAVLIFEERTPVEVLERVRPNLWVKGGDYARTDLVESQAVRRHGGEIVLLPYLEGRSTSRLVERARTSRSDGGEAA
ncbi:D-glycero-beta-D-manno-heptose 1-phosphate adenylyltransferase [Actinomadura scrupuli]|uniref:D-glycero-beta-D-manno-heptose 1-phosphate adenylyltransferase n=1 Tax=Actinomadura scrupuli TaxID=559629 RepID=UPI003D99647C